MKRDIDCIGFEASPHLISFMSETLSQIQHISPYDSYIDAFVEKDAEDFTVTLLVKHADGNFSAQYRSADLKQAITQSADAIVLQVRYWWKNRFKKAN